MKNRELIAFLAIIYIFSLLASSGVMYLITVVISGEPNMQYWSREIFQYFASLSIFGGFTIGFILTMRNLQNK